MAQAKVIPFDIYPEITKETIKLKKVYGQQMINYKKGLSTKPAPIHPCALNPMEIHRIATLVNNPRFFQLYDHGHTTIFYKNKPNQIIADIHFTDLSRINTACKDKSLCREDLVGLYVGNWLAEIGNQVGNHWRKNCEEFKQHIKNSEKASEILWDLLYNVGNKALEKNQQFMSKHDLPGCADPGLPNMNSSKNKFSTNLTFTADGFFNHPHKDHRDDDHLPFAFLLAIPTNTDNGLIALAENGYNVTGGEFNFPDCGFGISFKPNIMVQMIFAQHLYSHCILQPNESVKFSKLAISMQISQRLTNTNNKYLAGGYDEEPDMYIGDVLATLHGLVK
ncbi:hypothetical protein PSTG_13477 [Puccinia striiformis f. sp. tritici PST-78]|uniref:Tet-like 2OG-Fe(II) oxygenase domain-containing protein n=1 Tax=Puccinia striiformis f. sp. tritici PST-78 TaxID=1165861 RepID=A0A0L0V2E2_9BASI|nr:hypothetical protein PSTG_13477 [Puccinia striiformis f. sp. tritici PST-78]